MVLVFWTRVPMRCWARFIRLQQGSGKGSNMTNFLARFHQLSTRPHKVFARFNGLVSSLISSSLQAFGGLAMSQVKAKFPPWFQASFSNKVRFHRGSSRLFVVLMLRFGISWRRLPHGVLVLRNGVQWSSGIFQQSFTNESVGKHVRGLKTVPEVPSGTCWSVKMILNFVESGLQKLVMIKQDWQMLGGKAFCVCQYAALEELGIKPKHFRLIAKILYDHKALQQWLQQFL